MPPEVNSIVLYCFILIDFSPALQILHLLGYVHRDVSGGNVLMWKGSGKLADMEFVKKTSDLTIHEVRMVRFSSFAHPSLIEQCLGNKSI